ncbi:MAG: type II toxin-antitoxin system RelE/ParE family toxin [Flavobacteriales bacterium]|jgi:toxin ParE1/3/4
MAKYQLTKLAVNDLSEIWEYTYETWSEGQADKYYNLLLNAFESLAKKPKQGKIYDEISDEILCKRVSRHLIFYRELKDQHIEIIRILHESMDLKNQFQ